MDPLVRKVAARYAGDVIPLRRAPRGPKIRIKGRDYITNGDQIIVFLPEKGIVTVWDHKSGKKLYDKRVRRLPPKAVAVTNTVSPQEYRAITDEMAETEAMLERYESELELDPWKDR